MNKLALGGILLAIVFALGYATAKKYSPTIETQVVEKEVEKIVVKRDVKTIIRIIKDGNVVEERESQDNSTIISDSEHTSTTTVSKIPPPNWHIAVATDRLSAVMPSYQLQIERRVLGNMFIGGNVSTDNKYMLSIGMEF